MHQRIDITNLIKTPDEVKAMALKLLAGDKSMINPLIEAHIELAYKIAGKFIGKSVDKSPDKKDSIIAQALFELTRAVNNAANGKLYDENITKYIASSLHGYIHRFLVNDRLIPVEASAFREMAESGKLFEFLPITLLLQEDIDQYEADEEESFHPEYCNGTIRGISNCSDVSAEYMDAINEIKWRSDDEAIIKGLMEGYTYEGVGNILGKNKQFVMYRLKVIQRTLNEKLGSETIRAMHKV